MKLSEIKIYRITHIDNISHILKHGVTHRNSKKRNPNYIEIGDKSLINTRMNKKLIIKNNKYSNGNKKEIILGDYIPFYFGVRMPMLYIIQQGANYVEKTVNPENIIYLVCSLQRIIDENIEFYFTDGHAMDNLTTIYDFTIVHKLPELIDWNAIRTPYWGGNENLDIKRKKQAEFLVKTDLSPDFIVGFGCYNIESKNKLISLGVKEYKIKIIPGAYY